MGRDIGYKPEYCKRVVEVMSQGNSLTYFVMEIGSNRRTTYEWFEKFPEFKQAYEDGKAASKLYLENLLKSAMVGILPDELKKAGSTGLNMTAIIFALKTRCRDEYGDKQQVELSGNIDTTINFIEK